MKRNIRLIITGVACAVVLAGVGTVARVSAATNPGPQSGSVGVEGRISSPAPTQAATIATPSNGQTFTSIPITVSGVCPADTIVKVFSNGIFVGSAVCTNGSYTMQISLFSGRNDLVARVFDALDQQGPDSAVTTVTFNDAQYAQFGTHVLVTSQFARRAANPGEQLTWPIIVSGGLGPFAISIDWGDGSEPELRSEPFAGTFTFAHTYKESGVYKVTFKVVDANQTAGYLQVIAVTTGTIATNTPGSGTGDETIIIQRELLWWPMLLFIIPLILAFWFGTRYQLTKLRRQLSQDQ